MKSNGESMENEIGHMFRGIVKDILFGAGGKIIFVIRDDGEPKDEFVEAPGMTAEGVDEVFGAVGKAPGKRVVYYVDDKNKMLRISVEQ